jgi:hypothetical protein
VPAAEKSRKTTQRASTKPAQTRGFARSLNLRLPHRFKPLPGPPRTIFFSLAPLFVQERLLFALLAALLTTQFYGRHRSIIAHKPRD